MKERLSSFLQAEGLSSIQFARIMDIQPSSVSHLLNGRNMPGYEFIARILQKFPTLNPDWLILGKGSMYRQLGDSQAYEGEVIVLTSPDDIPSKPHAELFEDADENQGISSPATTRGLCDQPTSDTPAPCAEKESEKSIPIAASNSGPVRRTEPGNRETEKVIIFYDDHTFELYSKSLSKSI